MKTYDLLQDPNNDENYSNGIWDLSAKLQSEIDSFPFIEKQELIYNRLQEFKEAVLEQAENRKK